MADNHLKLKLICEIPYNYPAEEIPFLRVKSMTPEYLQNKHCDEYEMAIRVLAREQLGEQVLFNVAEYLREQICEINDKVVDTFNGIMRVKEEKAAEEKAGMVFS